MKKILIAYLLVSIAFAQTLPDEINYPPYRDTFLKLKNVSDDLWNNFVEIRDYRQQIEQNITEIENYLIQIAQEEQNLRQERNQNLVEQQDLQNQILNIQGQVAQLRQYVQGLDSEILKTSRQIESLVQHLRPLEQERQRQYNIFQQQEAELQRLKNIEINLIREIKKTENSLANRSHSLANVRTELSQLEEQNRQDQVRLGAIDREISQNSSQIAQLRNSIAQLEQKISSLESSISQKEQLKQQKIQRLNPEKQKLSQIESQISSVKSKISSLTSSQSQLETSISGLEQQIETLKREKISIPLKIDKAKQQITELEKRISENERNIDSLRSEISSLESKQAELEAKIRALQSNGDPNGELEGLKAQRIEVVKNIAKNKRVIEQQSAGINELKGQITAKRNEISSLTNELNTIDGKISALVQQKNSKVSELSSVKQELSSEQSKLSSLESQKQSQQQVVASIESEIQSITGEISTLQSQLKQHENEQRQKTAQVASLERESTQLQAEKREVEKRIAQFHTRRQHFISQISQIEQDIRIEGQNLARFTQDLHSVQNNMNNLVAQMNRTTNEIEELDRRIGATQQKIQGLENQMAGLQSQRNNTLANIDQANRDIANLQQNISSLQMRVGEIDNRVAQILKDRPLAQNDLANLKRELPGVQAQEQVASRDHQSALNSTQKAEAEYLKRERLYSSYLSQASDLGVADAKIGLVDGEKLSQKDTLTIAQNSSEQYLNQLTPIDSEYRASIRGEVQGYKLGYKEGYASATDEEQGRKEGIKAADQKAKTEAETIHLLSYRSELMSKLLKSELATLPIEMINSESVKAINQQLIVLKNDLKKLTEDSSDLTSSEIQESDELKTAVDSKISKLLVELKKVQQLKTHFLVGRNFYKAPTNITIPTAAMVSCVKVYKGLQVFKDKCKDSFTNTYQLNVRESHLGYFEIHYQNLFTSDFDSKFSTRRATNFANFKAAVFKVTQAEGLIQGKKDIKDHAFEAAFNQQYPLALEREKARVFNQAKAELDAHQKSKGILEIRDEANLLAMDRFGFSSGASVDLKLKLKNLGLKKSHATQAQIQIIKLENLTADKMFTNLVSLPADSNINLTKIFNLKILDSARPGDIAKIQVAFITADGTPFSTRERKMELSEKITVNPSVDFNLVAEVNPKLRTNIIPGIIRFYKKHEILVNLSPKFSGLSSGYKIELVVDSASQDKIEFLDDQSVITPVLAKNQNFQFKTRYKLNKRAKDQKIKLKLKIGFEGALIEEQIIEIAPKTK